MGLHLEPGLEALNALAPQKHLVGEIQLLTLGPGRLEIKLHNNRNSLKFLIWYVMIWWHRC